jgi:hypothetical protein
VFARATKDRILTRLDHEFRDTGSNEWSVSQALTYLGQHEKLSILTEAVNTVAMPIVTG